MSNLPTGTVTFLFTDIEGSTKRWEQYPRQMQAALTRHDGILRASIEANGGYVFKTVGDAFCAAFASPHDALRAALSCQQVLHGEQWAEEIGDLRVRMALHTGAVEEQGGDYFGQPVNRVARLLSAGHGGQTLLSLGACELVRDNLPLGATLLDMGEHRLKDLTRPEHIFQLVADGLPSEFPPLKTLDARPNNLPRQTTAFIGREKDVASLSALLRKPEVALATLTGPAGTGKTRLALQVGADLLDEFADGVWFVDLAPITEPKLVVSTIARTLGVTEAVGQALSDTLNAYLKEKRLLLLLDNFEQVVEAAGDVSRLLAACPGVKALATSRVPLRIRGEKEYAVSPLQLPDPQHLPPLERLTQYEAVRLFIERATDVKADFEVTNDNAPSVAEICARLDGLPLAIELAAARIRMLPPQALLSRLSQRLKVLTGGASDLPARQQTLRAAIEWSYDLLTEGEQQLLRRMAVFVGGSTFEAIEAVCTYDGQLEIDVLDGVGSLVGKSLLQQREGRDGEPRFVMLETIQEYAREKLGESGEAEALQKEHARYFMALAEEAEPHVRTGAKQVEWLHRLEEEHDNLRAAMRWARTAHEGENLVHGDAEAAEVGLRIAGALRGFWDVRGYYSEGRGQLEGMLALSSPSTASTVQAPPSQFQTQSQALLSFRAKALHGAGSLAHRQGDYATARTLYEESLAIRRELGEKWGIASSLQGLGNEAYSQSDYANARSLYEESLAIFRELGDKWGIARSLIGLGLVAYMQGDYASARSLYEESLAMFRELRDKWGIARSLMDLGDVAWVQGDYAGARSLYEESLAISRELGDKSGVAELLFGLGLVAYMQGDYASARSLYEESLSIQRELGDKSGVAILLGNLGNVAYSQSDYANARSLYEESLAMMRALGLDWGMACNLAGLGAVAAGMGQAQRGARLLGAAVAWMDASSFILEPDNRMVYEQGIASARSQLSEEAFEKAWAEGRAMSMDEAVSYALEPPPEPPAEPQPAAGQYPNGLSRREVEVLRLVARGLTDPQVAQELFLSVRTVESHLRSIYSKLGVATRVEAARFALEQGLV